MALAHAHLLASADDLLARWRRRFRPAHPLPERALAAMEQLLLPRPEMGNGRSLSGWREQVHYTAARLAKLGVPLAQMHQAFAAFRPLAVARLRATLGESEAVAALEWFQQQTQSAIAEAYVAEQSSAVAALLAVLDAELSSASIRELLERLLQQAARLFPVRCGEILLLEPASPPLRLRHAAAYGLPPGLIMEQAGAGPFFLELLRTGQPGFLLDAANDPSVAQPYYRELEIKSVWAVPLRGGSETLGIMTVAFDRVYECLPKEEDLLRALAERSALAIERTRMHESLQREQVHVRDLSRRLLDAHDEERRRISRDLHDETGQALLALRLYLEMASRPGAGDVRQWLRKGLALVDSSVAELRRILAELSPLTLDELGLEAALRQQLRPLRLQQGWRTRVHFALHDARLPRTLETLLYRVVLEGLRNIARHAHARQVHLRVTAAGGCVRVHLADDGVGLPAPAPPAAGFGLAGIRERVRLAGGQFALHSQPGRGVHLRLQIPLPCARTAPESTSHDENAIAPHR